MAAERYDHISWTSMACEQTDRSGREERDSVNRSAAPSSWGNIRGAVSVENDGQWHKARQGAVRLGRDSPPILATDLQQ